MGLTYIDRYSLLHFAVGVVANFWGIDKYQLLLYHTIFELVENTEFGMWVINNWVPFWPGGKEFPDAWINRLGDITFAQLGWWVASWTPWVVLGYTMTEPSDRSLVFAWMSPLFGTLKWVFALAFLFVLMV